MAEHVFREPVSSRTNSRAYPKPANSGRKKGARNQRLDHLAKVVAASGDPLITPDQRLRAAIARSLPTPGPTLTPSEAFPAEETFVGPIDYATPKTVEEARADRRQRRPDNRATRRLPDRPDHGQPAVRLRGPRPGRGATGLEDGVSGFARKRRRPRSRLRQPLDQRGGFSRWPDEGRLVLGDNLSYSGGLVVVEVPKGRTWPLTLSGAPARK